MNRRPWSASNLITLHELQQIAKILRTVYIIIGVCCKQTTHLDAKIFMYQSSVWVCFKICNRSIVTCKNDIELPISKNSDVCSRYHAKATVSPTSKRDTRAAVRGKSCAGTFRELTWEPSGKLIGLLCPPFAPPSKPFR